MVPVSCHGSLSESRQVTNGLCRDSTGGKPWVDAYDGARSDFFTC
jgi:hypothetical protein